MRRLQGAGLLGGGDEGGNRHVVVDHRRLNLRNTCYKIRQIRFTKSEKYGLQNERNAVAHRGLPALAGRCHHCVTLDASYCRPLSCTLGGIH